MPGTNEARMNEVADTDYHNTEYPCTEYPCTEYPCTEYTKYPYTESLQSVRHQFLIILIWSLETRQSIVRSNAVNACNHAPAVSIRWI
jgi:hypothetical protein